MCGDLNASKLSWVLRSDLGVRAYWHSTGHFLTAHLKNQSDKSKKPSSVLRRQWPQKYPFTDEKVFTIEDSFNCQNDRLYAKNPREAHEKAPRIQRCHHPTSVMVWWGVSYNGTTKLHFCEKGVKTSAKIYQDTVSEPILRYMGNTLFRNEQWNFQKDWAPGHKAKSTQQRLQRNVPDLISSVDWPSSSPDLNPLDYKLWSVLQDMSCKNRHPNIYSLKHSLVKAVADFPLEMLCNSKDEWPQRLKDCVKVKGGHFEKWLVLNV